MLEPEKYGYVFTNDSMSFFEACYRDAGTLGGAMGVFETLGDGFTQHTPLRTARIEHFTDYCVSLTKHLLENPKDDLSGYLFQDAASPATVQFLATVLYDEKRSRWFEPSAHKISTADAKEYDKRWHKVPTWANGSMESAFNLFRITQGNAPSFFETYAIHALFWDQLHANTPRGDWDKVTGYQEQMTGDHQSAFRGLKLVVEAREKLDYAGRVLSCAIHNSTIKKEAA